MRGILKPWHTETNLEKVEVTIECMDAMDFIPMLEDGSVSLLASDPPYFGIVADEWDNTWTSCGAFAEWLYSILFAFAPKLTDDGSIVLFGAIGKHGCHPLFDVMRLLEGPNSPYTYRNFITWQKRRAYGKSHDYLFCREEIVWYSKSKERTAVRFNIPLTDVKRGYPGWDKLHPAKSEYKRVSNVWTDIPELMRPARSCEKPVSLMRRIVETHSHPGDLVVDLFSGLGATSIAADQCGRRFSGCDSDVHAVNARAERNHAKQMTLQTVT
jgi:DNA modification methylase